MQVPVARHESAAYRRRHVHRPVGAGTVQAITTPRVRHCRRRHQLRRVVRRPGPRQRRRPRWRRGTDGGRGRRHRAWWRCGRPCPALALLLVLLLLAAAPAAAGAGCHRSRRLAFPQTGAKNHRKQPHREYSNHAYSSTATATATRPHPHDHSHETTATRPQPRDHSHSHSHKTTATRPQPQPQPQPQQADHRASGNPTTPRTSGTTFCSFSSARIRSIAIPCAHRTCKR